MQSPLNHAQTLATPLTTLAEFAVGDQQFQVVAVDDGADGPDTDAALGELICFTCGGCRCAIVPKRCALSTDLAELAALLTERELQITALVSQGKLNKQIADQLQISEWTVATHLRRVFSKLGVKSRAAMVYRCAPLLERLYRVMQTVNATLPPDTTVLSSNNGPPAKPR